MGMLEIGLIAAGALIFLISFCIPVKEEKLKEDMRNLAADEVRGLVEEELKSVRGRLSEISEEELKDKIGQSERVMERISNEKIMAVNEYSDTVLTEIHKNHEEVVFLYDILKNKKQALSDSYGKVDQNLEELLQEMKDSEITVREKLEEISERAREFEEMREQFFVDMEEARQRLLIEVEGMRQQLFAEVEGERQQLLVEMERARSKQASVKVVKKVVAKPKAEAASLAPTDAPREALPEVQAESLPEILAEAPMEIPIEIPVETQPEIPMIIPAETQIEIPVEISAETQPEISIETPTAIPALSAGVFERLEAPKEVAFKPFTPEKVTVVPKKAAPKKAVRKQEAEPEAKTRAKAKANPPAEDRELALVLSDKAADGEMGGNSNLRILKLHERGKSNMAIARELGLGIGEVQLVIDLYEGMGIK